MKVYKISDRLYRVHNEETKTVKDVWIKDGNIVPSENPHNTLTPTEEQLVEMEIF